MKGYLLDTNHAGMLLRDHAAPIWGKIRVLKREECVLCRPVVCELWYMVHNSARVSENQQRLEELLAQFDILELDAAAAYQFGLVRADLRKRAKPIPAIDVLIGAIALANDVVLATADAHFAHVEKLRTENWLTS